RQRKQSSFQQNRRPCLNPKKARPPLRGGLVVPSYDRALRIVVTPALVARLTLISIQAVALVARLAFISQLPGSHVRSNAFFQLFHVQFDALDFFFHLLVASSPVVAFEPLCRPRNFHSLWPGKTRVNV